MDQPGDDERERDEQRANWIDRTLYRLLALLGIALAIQQSGFSPVATWRALVASVENLTLPPLALPRLARPASSAGNPKFDAYSTAYERARDLTSHERWAEALVAVDAACRLDTEGLSGDVRAAAFLLRGQILCGLTRYDEAVQTIEQARNYVSGAPVYEALMVAYYRKQDYRQTVNYARDLLDSGARPSPQLYFILAQSHDRLGDVEQASQWIARGRAEFPGDKNLAKLGAKYDREAAAERGMSTRHNDRFILKFVEVREQSGLRDAIVRELDRAYGSTCAAYSYTPGEALPVILYPSASQYYSASGAPQWSGAQYDGKMRIPLPADATELPPELATVVTHEMTHYVIHQITGDRCPSWFDEGLAQLADQRDESWAAAELAAGQRFRLSELELPFARLSSASQARLAYAQALVTTRQIVDRVGMARVRGLLDQLGAGRSSREVFADLVDTR